jgi:hypothetical protein
MPKKEARHAELVSASVFIPHYVTPLEDLVSAPVPTRHAKPPEVASCQKKRTVMLNLFKHLFLSLIT